MRLFKKHIIKPKIKPDEANELEGPRVEGDIVYDENGDVLYDPTINITSDSAQIDFEAPDLDMSAAPELETPTVETPITDGFDPEFDHSALDDFSFDDEPAAEEGTFDEPEDESADYGIGLDTSVAITGIDDTGLNVDLPETVDVVNVTSEPAAPTVTEDPSLQHKRVNMGELRMDVARITSDIQSGERLYQRAQQRVESLMTFVERAEVDFSLLNRLEPENRRLKARNRVLEADSDANTHALRRMEKDLAAALEESATARGDLNTTKTRLTAAMSKISDKDREISRLTEQLEQVGLKIERTQTSVEVESRENLLLREQIAELSTRLDDVTSERMEFAKIVESLKIDCDDFRNQREQALSEVSDLRLSLSTAQKINGQMKAQMVSLHEEIKGFKTQYEFNVISREDRITTLESRITDLTKQLAIKEDVTKSALADVGQLRKTRTSQDLERERLERVIETQQRQLDEAQAHIERSSDSMAKMDQRYNDVAAALSVYQKRLSTNEAAEDIAAPLAAPPPFQSDEMAPLSAEEEKLTPENIEEMIMDYKLGLRSQIG